jgi:hypothetical protein
MPRKVLLTGRKNTSAFPLEAMDQAALVNNQGMPYEATLLRASGVASGGTVRKTYTPDSDTVPCRIGPVGGGGAGSRAGDRVNEDSTHVITFARAVSLDMDDRVRVNDREYLITAHTQYGPSESGRRWEVAAI